MGTDGNPSAPPRVEEVCRFGTRRKTSCLEQALQRGFLRGNKAGTGGGRGRPIKHSWRARRVEQNENGRPSTSRSGARGTYTLNKKTDRPHVQYSGPNMYQMLIGH